MTINKSGIYTARLTAFWAIFLFFSILGYYLFYNFIAFRNINLLKISIITVYSILNQFLAYGTTLSIFGLYYTLFSKDTLNISMRQPYRDVSLKSVKTAIVMPIYGEDPTDIFSRIEVIYKSLKKEKSDGLFHFFVLSDTRDNENWIQEEREYLELCERLKDYRTIFYRRRRSNLNGKSGNIGDFCRRWGNKYDYMTVLDADSLMTGKSIVALSQLMTLYPESGILQTNPGVVRETSLFQKMMKFSMLLNGTIFANGYSSLFLNSASFWGHNAIIRLELFLKYCALPHLPKLGAVGGRILSHDTIEAALMRKAGYSIWFVNSLDGSYEEYPPNVMDSLKRDHRWCQGNLQHFWFFFIKGIRKISRVNILLGIFSYLNSLLWLIFLILMSINHYFELKFFKLAFGSEIWKLFWEKSYEETAFYLGIYTLTMLFFPRLVSLIYALLAIILKNKKFSNTTGFTFFPFMTYFLLDTIHGMIVAPILMIKHVHFILSIFLGKKVIWNPQNRNAENVPYLSEIVSFLIYPTILGVLTFSLIFIYIPSLVFWMAPIYGPWILSIPIVSFTSKVYKSTYFKDFEEPEIVKDFNEHLEKNQNRKWKDVSSLFLLIADPMIREIHTKFLPNKKHEKKIDLDFQDFYSKPLSEIRKKDYSKFFYNKSLLKELHIEFWTRDFRSLPQDYQKNLEKYLVGLYLNPNES
ncbi:MAG: glucans biosynthesis glucosyltransferase MdoH [Leptospiraceae bacterium]|nr:glucans biosynthesis glucosyltransferase MdoH [Leptospiraceae bacterium]MCP5511601.1 glucans biosynthesis glucosyltransferase MdoH [Leptospiraceae bacterium]